MQTVRWQMRDALTRSFSAGLQLSVSPLSRCIIFPLFVYLPSLNLGHFTRLQQSPVTSELFGMREWCYAMLHVSGFVFFVCAFWEKRPILFPLHSPGALTGWHCRLRGAETAWHYAEYNAPKSSMTACVSWTRRKIIKPSTCVEVRCPPTTKCLLLQISEEAAILPVTFLKYQSWVNIWQRVVCQKIAAL